MSFFYEKELMSYIGFMIRLDNYIYSFKTIKKYLSRVLIRGMKSFKKNLTIFKKIFMFLFLTNDKRRVIKGN